LKTFVSGPTWTSADDSISPRAWHARTREHDPGRKLAIRNVEHAAGHSRCTGARSGEGAQAFSAEKCFTVDLEFRVVGRLYGHAAEIAVPMVERAQRNNIPAGRFIDLEQRTANAHRLFIDRRDLCNDEGLGHGSSWRRYDIDQVRGSEVEVELQQRRQAATHGQLVAVGQPDPELRLLQRRAGLIGNDGLFRTVSEGDEYLRVAVVEGDRTGNVGRGRDRGDRNELGQVDIVREVDAGFAGQRLHYAAVGRLERQ
jgi:hypothetical protein